MNEKLKDTENLLNILHNNILFYLQQFDRQLSLIEKQKSIDQLNRLITKYDSQTKKAKEEYYIASQYEKSQFRKALKENSKQFNKLSDEITERANLLRILSMGNNSFIAPNLSIDLGQDNQHSLDYSKIKTVINEAKMVYKETNEYLQELESDIKKKPLIGTDDSVYQSYLNYMRSKQEMIQRQKRRYLKYIFFSLIGFVVIIMVLYYIVFHIGKKKANVPDIDAPDV